MQPGLKYLFLPLILCFHSNISFTQIVDVRNCFRCSITKNLEILRNETIITIDSVLSPGSSRFESAQNKKVISPTSNGNHSSFKFLLKNSDSKEKNLVLILGPVSIRESEIFQSDKGKWKSLGKTGRAYSYKKRAYQFSHYTFPIKVQANHIDTFYLNIVFGNDFRSSDLVLMETKRMKYFENQFYFYHGIIIGLMLLFFIINIYLFFAIKERIHLWYSVYILLMIVIVLGNDLLLEQFLAFPIEGGMLSAIGAIAVGILIHVLQSFLASNKGIGVGPVFFNLMKWVVIGIGVSLMAILSFRPGLYIKPLVFDIVNYTSLFGLLVILIYCMFRIEGKLLVGWFLIAAILISIMGSVQRLVLDGYSTDHSLSLFHVGIILETTFISFVLIYRYRQERKENIRYLQEKEQLKVAHKKQLLLDKIETRETIFKKISQEIHDNIGQLLTLVKINLDTAAFPVSSYDGKKMEEAEELLNKSERDLYQLSKSLHPEIESDTGVLEYIKAELELMNKTSLFETQLFVEGNPFPIVPGKEIILFRICQEVFNNIIKHAKANRITVGIDYKQKSLSIRIQDNGKGFSLAEISQEKGNYGLGIRNMQSRVRSIGGDLQIESSPGAGTGVTINLVI